MIVVCLGDSLTEGDYGVFGKSGIANVQEENYPYFLGKILQTNIRNYGRCGYRASQYLQHYQDGCVNVKDADIILIMLGTNGGHSAVEETPENASYRALIDACKRDAPGARIVLCTPPHATSDPQYSNCGYAEQVEQAVLFVRALAAQTRLDMIDVAACPYFTAQAEHIMQPNDGLHFGRVGYATLANYIAEQLTEMLHA